jgi:hypothetical protein
MTPLSRLRELAARSTQIKELASKEKDSPTIAPVSRGALVGSMAGLGLGATAGAAMGAGSYIAGKRLLPAREYLKLIRPIRKSMKDHGVSHDMLPVAAGYGFGKEGAKIGAGIGAAGGALHGARIKGRDEERFKNKEFGLLTKNEPAYDKDGHFTGVENHYNGPGIAEAAGGAAVLGAGLGAGHVGVMKKYGTETLRREKGRFISPREVKVPVGQAYKKAGSDVLAKIRSLAGKRFSAKDRLKELADASVALKSFDQKVDENGHPILDAAASAGLGVGAALGHGAVMRKYGSGKVGLNGMKQAYGAAANDFKGGFSKGFNPPSTSAGSGSVATAATNSPLPYIKGRAPAPEPWQAWRDREEAAAALKKASPLYRAGARAGSKAGRLGAVIRGFLSRMR